MKKLRPRPIGTQFTMLIPPSAQIHTSATGGLWIADTYEITGHEIMAHGEVGEKVEIIKTQKVKRGIGYCVRCGQLFE